MKNKFVIALFIAVISLSGCATQEASRIYTVCRQTEAATYVYNMDGGFYTYTQGKLYPCNLPDLQKQPRLTIVFDDNTEFQLAYEMPGVYLGTKEDAVRYATKLLLADSGLYSLVSVDWKSFEMLITSDNYDVRLIYTTDNKVRIYAQDKDGVAIVPPYLEDLV